MAAHAVTLFGIVPSIYSIKQKSELPGAIYLHERIPYLTSPLDWGSIIYEKMGSAQGYAEKVYGYPKAKCSWYDFNEGPHSAYSLHQAYDELWKKYEDLILDVDLRTVNIEAGTQDCDIVMSTIPVPVLCRIPQAHNFRSQEIFIWEGLPEDIPNGHVVYNGEPEIYWYRASNIFGHQSTEMVGRPPHDGFKTGVKPLDTDCNCYPRFHRLGRYGRWEKGVLTHNAFHQAVEIMKKFGMQKSALL